MWTGITPFVGMVARVACHTYCLAVAQAKSFTVSAWKRHTSRPLAFPIAVARPGPISSGPTMVVTASDCVTLASRSRAAAVSTCSGFCSTPVPLTIQPAGTSMFTSNVPKLL